MKIITSKVIVQFISGFDFYQMHLQQRGDIKDEHIWVSSQ